MKTNFLLSLLFVLTTSALAQNVSINATGAAPDTSSILDISSTKTGLLIPRMTTAQRDSIFLPANALQIFNTTTNTIDIFNNNRWESVFTKAATNNIIHVYSLSDLPIPEVGKIALDGTKMYIFSGIVDISPNYLSLNGAGIRGIDPAKDGIMSSTSGGILRSTGHSVFLTDLAVIPLSATTRAYDFADASGTKFCNIFSGCSVVEIGIPSLGVGQVSGFNAVTIEKNYWNCTDGIKITGTMGKFCSSLNFITGLTAGSAIEFLAGANVLDVDLANNYFVYTGQTGVKVNVGAFVDRGRMTTNMFRGVGTLLNGFDSYTPGWQMLSNTDIPNSRAFSFLHMSSNTNVTYLPIVGNYYKIAGTTTTINAKKFSSTSNRITYTGKTNTVGEVFVIIGAKAPANGCEFTIAIAKNGVLMTAPTASMATATNNQAFQITFITEVNLSTNDYIEVFIKSNNSNANHLIIDEMQFRISN